MNLGRTQFSLCHCHRSQANQGSYRKLRGCFSLAFSAEAKCREGIIPERCVGETFVSLNVWLIPVQLMQSPQGSQEIYTHRERDRVENERRFLGPPNFTGKKQADKTSQLKTCAIFHEK